MDRDPANGCAPVFPWQFVRTNSIFGVIHKAGGYTAWSDKHPAYASVAGQDGTERAGRFLWARDQFQCCGSAQCDDTGWSGFLRDGTGHGADLTAWTNSFKNIQVLRHAEGERDPERDRRVESPGHAKTQDADHLWDELPGGQCGREADRREARNGGYLDAAGTPTATLLSEIEFADDAIGEMVNKLKDRGQYESTLIIVTAKHGQSPIDPNLYDAVPGKTSNGSSPATIISTNLGAIPMSEDPNNGQRDWSDGGRCFVALAEESFGHCCRQFDCSSNRRQAAGSARSSMDLRWR